MVDFRTLTSKPADKIKRPPTLPAGTYHGIVSGQEFGESKNKKTPFCKYALRLTAAGDDVDQSRLATEDGPIDISKKQFSTDFYLTPDSEYRLVEFLVSCGIEKSGRSLGEMIPGAIGKPVLVTITEQMSQAGDGSFFNQVGAVKGAE